MSTYSPDLRIELITTGDQAGVWGNTTNNNLAYVVEQAIAGYVSVSVIAANQAFTYLNGGSVTAADNQAVHASIALTTTTGANFAVYAPPASKQYTIYNASAYTATIYNSTVIGNTTAAGTGVAIPAGKTVTVWSDGANFSSQNTHLPGTVTSATAASGTSTTQLATTAFVQTALQLLHPVGSIYMNATNSANPNSYLGFGTWAAFGAGRVPVGFNAGNPLFDTAEETGGSYDATLVSHTHTGTTGLQSQDHAHSFNVTSGGGGAHNHLTGVGAQSGFNNGYGDAGNQGTGWRIVNNQGAGVNSYVSSVGDHVHNVSGGTSGVNANHSHDFTTNASGSSATNANIQPYITVYMWKRVS
jgi:hypothetical protein